jgi:tetraacyldisaccharide 4'-kinase
MLKKLEAYFVDLIQGKKKGLLASLIKFFLICLSWVYQFIIAIRNWAFDHGCFRQYYAPVPVVISIGNIVVGGTGKTPVTLMLAKEFYDDFEIAILSRGYRSKAEHLPTPILLCQGEGPIHPAWYCGDEPYLIAQNLPKTHVFVGKNRHLSSNMAAKAGAQLILLDDGMQHRHLARDFEVVVLDAKDPFGQGYFLPRGFLRESITSLSRANIVIVNHVKNKQHFQEVKAEIEKLTQAPLVATRMEVLRVVDLESNELPSLEGKKVGIFCAIAHPDYFHQTIKQMGAEIVAAEFIPDHLAFTNEELKTFCQRCIGFGAEWILCTEKDYVKLDKDKLSEEPIAWLKMGLTIVEGEEHWQKFTAKAKEDIKKRI